MTVRVMALLAKHPDISREEFMEYYRTQHAVLIKQIADEICGYERNFVVHTDVIRGSDAPELDFDVVTIIDYPNEEAYQAALAKQQSPEGRKAIHEDELNLFDQSKLRYFRVDVQRSEF
ncbi:EthD domain-containing protein [Enemella sp. A6]|uniref:EthD domain-containing protein n=1 Tax=Enemella sp. A6 TaxID=3440152 RepID=UPI003EBFD520